MRLSPLFFALGACGQQGAAPHKSADPQTGSSASMDAHKRPRFFVANERHKETKLELAAVPAAGTLGTEFWSTREGNSRAHCTVNNIYKELPDHEVVLAIECDSFAGSAGTDLVDRFVETVSCDKLSGGEDAQGLFFLATSVGAIEANIWCE